MVKPHTHISYSTPGFKWCLPTSPSKLLFVGDLKSNRNHHHNTLTFIKCNCSFQNIDLFSFSVWTIGLENHSQVPAWKTKVLWSSWDSARCYQRGEIRTTSGLSQCWPLFQSKLVWCHTQHGQYGSNVHFTSSAVLSTHCNGPHLLPHSVSYQMGRTCLPAVAWKRKRNLTEIVCVSSKATV